jgi:hypothetical protein
VFSVGPTPATIEKRIDSSAGTEDGTALVKYLES